ncbi:MAG: hypothetical protein ACK5LT_12115 [Lachnospirales bacterium]
MSNNNTQKIVLTGIFTAIAIAVGLLSIQVSQELRIAFSNPFLYFIGYSVSPLYCAIAYGVYDIISLLLKPTGAFVIFFTLVSVLKGFLFGVLYLIVTKINKKKIVAFFASVAACFIGAGALGIYMGKTYLADIADKANYFSYISIIIGIVFILFVVLIKSVSFSKDMSDKVVKLLKLFFVLLIVGFISTTLNTKTIQMLYTPDKLFLILLIPRLISSFLTAIYNTFVLYILISIYEFAILKTSKIKEKLDVKKASKEEENATDEEDEKDTSIEPEEETSPKINEQVDDEADVELDEYSLEDEKVEVNNALEGEDTANLVENTLEEADNEEDKANL